MRDFPDVEAARLIARRVAVGRRITGVWCAADPIVFEGVSPVRFRRALLGRQVLAVRRHGKHLWLALDRRPWPTFHFGMTGGLHTPRGPALTLLSSPGRDRPILWPPPLPHPRVTLAADGEGAPPLSP